MKNAILEIFSEKGSISSLRVMSMISLLAGCYIGIVGIHSQKPLSEVAILAGVFVSAAFAGKVAQKSTELKNNDKET